MWSGIAEYELAEPTMFGDTCGATALILATADNERMVRAYVAALCDEPQAVDDLAQEVFVRALARIERMHDPANPGPFLRGIARHVVQEHFRSRRRDRIGIEWAASALGDDAESVSSAYDEHEVLERLAREVADLPVVARRMLQMRYDEGCNASDIGRALGIRPTAVRVTLLRIRERLRRRLDASLDQ